MFSLVKAVLELFSDGKLTTGINSVFCKTVLETFVKFGAPEEILYTSKPHIGTDNLVNILRNIREYILANGGTFCLIENLLILRRLIIKFLKFMF